MSGAAMGLPNPTMKSRFRGCLLGGAVGDALGAPVEFQSAGSIFRQYGPRGITNLPQPGVFTDDTQMTLFTAEGLISAVGQNLIQMPTKDHHPSLPTNAISMLHQSYLRWLATQDGNSKHDLHNKASSLGWLVTHQGLHRREAPGQTCLSALRSGRIGSRQLALNDSKGCGGVMRVAPAGLIVHSVWPEESAERKAWLAYELGCAASAITHSHPAGWQSGGVLAAVISYILSGEELLKAIQLSCTFLEREKDHAGTLKCVELSTQLASQRIRKRTEECAEIEAEVARGIQDAAVEQDRAIVTDIERIGGGWIGEEALGIALYCCILAGNDFESGLIWSVNHSGDSDSTGAIVGNILGAMLGEESIPERWVKGLDMTELVGEAADDLFASARKWAEAHVKSGKYPPLLQT